jgi:muconolactone D-isomerase
VEFLIEIHVRLPGEMDPERRGELLAAELERGRQLHVDGVIRRIWRVPGALRNVGIWSAADAQGLHAAIASLPLFPWLDVEVTPLAQHPIEGAEHG